MSVIKVVDKDKNDEKQYLDLITTSISVCISTGYTPMSNEVIEAARKYYLNIVNDNTVSVFDKRQKIHKDLVIGTKNNLDNDIQLLDPNDNLLLKYRIGLNNDQIKQINSKIICIGQYKDNDIYVESNCVSRIHCFIFRINNKLIILDGWSKYGTFTVDVVCNQVDQKDDNNDNNNKLINSTPKHRNILKFNIDDTIHIRLGCGQYGKDIIINPKICIVCMERARVIRLKCGHQVLCNTCFKTIQNTLYSSKCPICRKPFSNQTISLNYNYLNQLNNQPANGMDIINNNDNNNNNIIGIASAGLHTFNCSSNTPST